MKTWNVFFCFYCILYEEKEPLAIFAASKKNVSILQSWGEKNEIAPNQFIWGNMALVEIIKKP